MESRPPKRRFPPPWRVDQTTEGYAVRDANSVALASVYCRDDLQRWAFTHGHLSCDEALKIAKAIAACLNS